ncbi:twin-arginine translocase subunit TatC [Amphritea atlantica]|uniref:Sec-independent protein translocase protein TatC n=1 Tax=Amphritea atlantica TaxID=355243 RepID=A0ABY5GUK7_9GAMM|nr:twin-arginine translocase subunit TatC [Amphritea atlantica]
MIDPNQTHSEDDQEQPIVSHLVELRSRLMRALLAILILFLCLFYFANNLYEIVSAPLTALLPEGTSMIATDVTSPFFAPFKLTLVLSIFLAMPLILHQVWGFISPGLYKHEKRLAVPLLASSIVLFYSGIAFAYFVVFPLIFGFFTSVGPENVAVMTDISSYLNFVLKIFFAFGVVFEIPIATLLLVWSGITDVQSLRAKRAYVIVGCFVLGMLLTPPDVISQTLLAVPMWLLFELGIILAVIIKRRAPADDEEQNEVAD